MSGTRNITRLWVISYKLQHNIYRSIKVKNQDPSFYLKINLQYDEVFVILTNADLILMIFIAVLSSKTKWPKHKYDLI